ncbi:MAG TPA: phosphopantetheine-binding protein, partial [Candidatus Deferrimicrobium sp.]|nr:phosphopantetheine-binding protein [Candidatus Deferrimicrobium sp.]
KFNRSYKSYRSYIFYKTGDLARRLPDGNVEFLGRIDQQVKIRGFRIELGEIEAELSKHALVKEAVVVDREGETGETYLCGYIVMAEKFELLVLKEFLSKRLPNYMVPSYFIGIESIPLNPNGKVDRKMLPAPGIISGEDYIPGNEIEEKVAAIWSEVLEIEKSKLSVNADFFDLGGHSLKATVMVAKIYKVFNLKLQLIQVFTSPTIRGIASLIEATKWINAGKSKEPAGDVCDVQETEEIIL